MHPTALARRSSIAAITVALLALSACGGDDPGPDEPETTPSAGSSSTSPSGSGSASVDPSPTTEPDPEGMSNPTKFDGEAATTFEEVDVRDSAITDSVALTMTSDRVVARSLPSLSLVYEVPAEAGLLTDLDVDEDAGTGIVVQVLQQPGEGTRIGSESFTVTQFDLATGDVIASITGDVAPDSSSRGTASTAKVVGVSDGVVVLDTWPGDPNDAFGAATARHTTVAIDIRAGDLAWSKTPAQPLGVQGGLVLVNTGTSTRAGTLSALTLAEGRSRWSALPGTGNASLVGMTDARAIVATARPGAEKAGVVPLSLANGKSGASVPSKSWLWRCLPGSPTIAVCNIGVDQLVGWDLGSNRAAWKLPTPTRFAPVMSTVDEGVVYALVGQSAVTLDPLTGEDEAVDTGAAPTGVSVWGGLSVLGGQAVFQPAVTE